MNGAGRVGVAYHAETADHDPGQHHPERVERARLVAEGLRAAPVAPRLDWITPEPAAQRWLETVHSADYIRFVEEACLSERTVLDFGDTRVSAESFRAATLGTGGALALVDGVLEGRFAHGFACHRPPGHHARTEAAMGFCLFNHVAIAARYAQRRHGLGRVAIIDWDVHHGNGTQETFYADPTVWFGSLHQWPHYPGTGALWETGSGPGVGSTLNVPLTAGTHGAAYRRLWTEQMEPPLRIFRPELILISAGFDAHRDDPLAAICLEDEDYAWLTRRVTALARETGAHGVVSLLEGGYNLPALVRSAIAHVTALAEGAGAAAGAGEIEEREI